MLYRLDHNLGKELKDTGFPQEGVGQWLDLDANEFHSLSGNTSRLVYIPTLSELIEVCGDKFDSLYNHGDYWHAVATRPNPDYVFKEWGYTPEEAVAKLYLDLHSEIKAL